MITWDSRLSVSYFAVYNYLGHAIRSPQVIPFDTYLYLLTPSPNLLT